MLSNTEASLAPFLFVRVNERERERERVVEVLERGVVQRTRGGWKRICAHTQTHRFTHKKKKPHRFV